MFKKILFPLVALFMLAGCAKPPTTIEVSPTITLPQQDPSLMGVTVSINGADQRTDQCLVWWISMVCLSKCGSRAS